MGFNLQLGDVLRSGSVTAIDDAIREIVRQEIARTPRSKFCESCAYMHQPEISARCCCVACHGDDVPAWAQRMNTPPSIEKTGESASSGSASGRIPVLNADSPASPVKPCPFGPVEASVERFLRAIEARLDVDDDDAHILSRDGLELLKIAWSNRRTPAPSPAGDPGDWTCRCGRHVSWPGLVCAACGHEHPWKPAPSPATGESASPPSEQTAKELDELLAVFAKGDGDDEDCWTQHARRGVQYVSDLEWDLETQVRLASHRAEANESLRIMLSNLAAYTGTHFGPDEPLKNYERVRKTLTDKPEPPSIAAEKAEEPDAPGIAEAPDGTLPCVYCSNENLCVEIRDDKHPGMLGFSVRCGSATTFCGARGPVRPAQMDAVEEWNRAYRWVHPPKGAAPKPASEVELTDAEAQRLYDEASKDAKPFGAQEVESFVRTTVDPQAEVLALQKQRNDVYEERDRLVAALSKCFPSWLARHPNTDRAWDDDWRWIVFVQLPTGQATWHIQDRERAWFDHLEVRENSWDGHTTEEKYRRLERLPAIEAQGEPTLEECQSAYWLAHNAHESSDQPVLYAINAVRDLCISRAPSHSGPGSLSRKVEDGASTPDTGPDHYPSVEQVAFAIWDSDPMPNDVRMKTAKKVRDLFVTWSRAPSPSTPCPACGATGAHTGKDGHKYTPPTGTHAGRLMPLCDKIEAACKRDDTTNALRHLGELRSEIVSAVVEIQSKDPSFSATREACARVCEKEAEKWSLGDADSETADCVNWLARRIRALREEDCK